MTAHHDGHFFCRLRHQRQLAIWLYDTRPFSTLSTLQDQPRVADLGSLLVSRGETFFSVVCDHTYPCLRVATLELGSWVGITHVVWSSMIGIDRCFGFRCCSMCPNFANQGFLVGFWRVYFVTLGFTCAAKLCPEAFLLMAAGDLYQEGIFN